jgi:flagellin
VIINHNITGLFTHRQSAINNLALDKSMEKLASGMRINRAADDAAGLAISEKMRSQIRGLRQAERNGQDGISFIQTTEGYLNSTQSVLQRLRELAVQAANGIYTEEDRMQIQVELSQLVDEVDRIASHAQFNTLNLLTGRFARPGATNVVTASMWVHIGANMDQREQLYIQTMTAQGLGLRDDAVNGNPQLASRTISFSTIEQANRSIAILDKSLELVSKQRADLGAYQNRLEFAIDAIMTGHQNLQASESRIRDTNMAEVSTHQATNNILVNSAIAMLAQANVRPQLVLQLLR